MINNVSITDKTTMNSVIFLSYLYIFNAGNCLSFEIIYYLSGVISKNIRCHYVIVG